MSDLIVDVAANRGNTAVEVCLSAAEGTVTALVGPSGSGKTSLLRLIAGLDRPSRGRVALGEAVWFDGYTGAELPVSRRGVGFVFQDYALFPHMTAADNVGYGVPRRYRKAAVAHWLSQMDLAPYAAQYPRALSGGQRQRVALARTLAARPRLLLLDEPFSAVDVQLRRQLQVVLRMAAAELECPVLMVSHDLAEVSKLAQQLVVMTAGKVLGAGPTAAMFATPPTPQVADILGVGPVSGRESIGVGVDQCRRCGLSFVHEQQRAQLGTAIAM